MKNQEIYKQAFSALQPKGDLLPRVEKRRRPAFSNGMRRLAVAAVLCALMAVGAVAVYRGWSFTFAFDGNRRYQVTLEEVDVEKAPKTLEKLYCPTALPGNAALWRVSGDPEQGSAEWEWRMDYTDQYTWTLRFYQYTLEQAAFTRKLYEGWNTWEIEDVMLGEIPVTRVVSKDAEYDWPIGISLYWTDGDYGYRVFHNGPQYFTEEEQAAMVASLNPVEHQKHVLLKEETALHRPVDYALEKLWVPAAWQEGLTFVWEPDHPYGATWAFENAEGYGIHCRQRHIDSKQQGTDSQTQYEMAWAWRREELELGGKQVFTVGVESETSRGESYYLVDNNVLCLLTVDDELAKALGLTREELAARVLESMTLMERPAAEQALEALQ